MDVSGGKIDPDRASPLFLERIPRDFARLHHVLSQGVYGDREVVAITTETAPTALWNTAVCLGRAVDPITVPAEDLVTAIDRAYARELTGRILDPATHTATTDGVPSSADTSESLERVIQDADRDLLRTDGKAPVVRLLDRLLLHAVQAGASDCHIHPTPDAVLVRCRIDGVLDAGRRLPRGLVRPLVSRIKVIGRMDVAEHLLPQDGRTSVTIGDRSIDIRISTIPTAHGERVVLRLLDTDQHLLDLHALGMPDDIATVYRAATRRSSGIVLVTGPTGSGKTTTLYATLRQQDTVTRNLMTIEDPIEYELSALGIPISQSQVNIRKGLTFATGLRHILRQDPDVILIGEIRDAETARIAIQASLTGHLVFSTLHTNNAAAAVTRLLDLGVEPYLVAASLAGVLAQRLVRTCCRTCAGQGTLGAENAAGAAGIGATCPTCLGSGFKGRTGLYEWMAIDDAVRANIASGSTAHALHHTACSKGMRTLEGHGLELIASGRTTHAEIERVIHHG